MKNVLVIFGFGPGISNAVAQKCGAEGFSVALVSRNRARLDAGVAALRSQGVDAAAFVAGTVKGSAFDSGSATLEPSTIADEFWRLYTVRQPYSVTIS